MLASGLAGTPRCIDAVMTQIARADRLKKKTENQSIAAAVLRWKVGRAKAASTARPGRASISARS